mgnify:CR=1 FL=1
MSGADNASVHERWASFRFSVVGQLLAAPPPKGMLRRELKQLAARMWRHPITGAPVRPLGKVRRPKDSIRLCCQSNSPSLEKALSSPVEVSK